MVLQARRRRKTLVRPDVSLYHRDLGGLVANQVMDVKDRGEEG